MKLENMFYKYGINTFGLMSYSNPLSITFLDRVIVRFDAFWKAFVISVEDWARVDVVYTIKDAVTLTRERLIESFMDDLDVPTPYEILRLVVDDPDHYHFDGVVYHRLDEIPFDRWSDEKYMFIHATGYEYWDGVHWETEYEDDLD